LEQHVKIVAILNIVLGGISLLIAVGMLLLFGGLAGIVVSDSDPDAAIGAAILGTIGGLIFVCTAVFSIPSIIGGYGLLKYRPWAQTLTIVMSILNLISVPFGTALGIYGLWVLLNRDAKPLFKPA
jgi:hypothetical protein